MSKTERNERNIKNSLSYFKYSLRYVIFWKILHIPLHFEVFNQYKLRFFHYSIFLSLFEDMFLNEEYYVQLRNKPTIIDLGSEVGISVFYFKYRYPESEIMAFEPDPHSYELLLRNIKVNNIPNTLTYNVALSDRVGVIPFYVDPKVRGSLTMSIHKRRQSKRIQVRVVRLSNYITKKIDLVKMDIEGAEHQVLKDLVATGKIQLIQNLIIEYHHHISPSKNEFALFLQLLENAGFGYQIQAKYKSPFEREKYQDFLIFAYKQ